MVANRTVLTGWVAGALALCLALAALVKQRLPRSLTAIMGLIVGLRGLIVCAAVVGACIGSAALHLAVLDPPSMYGATTEEAWGLIAYSVAPLGKPLLVASILLLAWNMANRAIPPRGGVR